MDTYLKIFIVAASVAVLLQAGILIATYLAVARVERETRIEHKVRRRGDDAP